MAKTEKLNMQELAGHRSSIYGFLAAVYRQEVTSELLRQIKTQQFQEVLSSLGVKLNKGFFQDSEKELLENLAIEYTRLFVGPGKHISPHESVHHKKEGVQSGQLWGELTGQVKNIIESSGLEYKSEYTGMPDHISVELEFMQQFVQREAQAWEADDDEAARLCLKNEKNFVDQHLSGWIPSFCEKVSSAAEMPFYREMARLTRSFIEFEKQELIKLAQDTDES
ncbi:MAG: molecular chaperone TorD family protein [bacterium]|nr:molecular chaperone TorD family protein [bacterium]